VQGGRSVDDPFYFITIYMPDKEKFRLEFIVKSSSSILYNYISTPSGMSEWFSDNVNIKGDVYTFFWDGSEEKAKLLNRRDKEYIRFQWIDDVDDGNDYFFEMRVTIDPLTNEVALLITDFAEPDEKEEAILLWENQIDSLKHVLGS